MNWFELVPAERQGKWVVWVEARGGLGSREYRVCKAGAHMDRTRCLVFVECETNDLREALDAKRLA